MRKSYISKVFQTNKGYQHIVHKFGRMRNMHINHQYKAILYFALFMFLPVILTGCSTSSNTNSNVFVSNGTDVASKKEDNYDTQTQGVVKEIDTTKNTITYQDIPYEKEYTLNYNGASDIYDKYEQAIAMSQIKIGEIVDLYYASETNKLAKLQISSDTWEYKGVKNLVIDKTNKIMSISDQKYQYTDSIVIASKDDLIGLIDINSKDELIVKGKEGKIYSVIVDKGHGYIRLSNYEDFIGGMVEVGYDIIIPVVKDMLIVSKEGNYKITLENGQLTGSKNINVLRDEEVVVDMSDFKLEPVKKSNVEFKITPNGASLYVDDELTDYDKEIKLPYGKHTIVVKLSGYTTYTGVLTVDATSMDIAIDLVEASASDTKTDTTTDPTTDTTTNTTSNATSNTPYSAGTSSATGTTDTSSDNSTESTSSENNSSNYIVDKEHKIYLQTPVGSDAYLDGKKIGTVPVSLDKSIGSHIITFSKDGFTTKSYTVEIANDSQDVYFSFPDMTASN